jgi:Zn-dependent M28 family amino/carboxypeptidase
MAFTTHPFQRLALDMPSPLARLVLALSLFTVALMQGTPAAQKNACDSRPNTTQDKLQECVTLSGVRAHQAALQSIADANGRTRVSASPGFDLSLQHAQQVFAQAGYTVGVQTFLFQTFVSLHPSVLQQTAPGAATYDNIILGYSGSGDVTAPVTALPGPPADATPGCEAADFAAFPPGHIALIPRGSCDFAVKATLAFQAGAKGVVLYNDGSGSLAGSLGEAFTPDLPVVGIQQSLGQQLAATPGLALHLKTTTRRGMLPSYNLLAESRDGDPNNVVMVGAHLDSLNSGPGINDNGSGVAAILEVAKHMARVKPKSKLRFALWGAEESNLVGSIHYVNELTLPEREQIALYLNFDMIGSPNHGFFILDGDDSDAVGAGPGPPGSAEIEQLFASFYAQRRLPVKGTDLTGRSDYRAFTDIGIPAGGVFSGAEAIKTTQEAALFGGTAGQSYDPCYHEACDGYANVSPFALDVNSDAVAFATLHYAMSTFDATARAGRISGKRVQPPPREPPPRER